MFMPVEKIREIQARCANPLAKELVEMNRYDNKMVKSNTIGVEACAEWKTLVTIVRWSAYKVFYQRSLIAGKDSADDVDMTEICADVRRLLACVGEVNGVKLCSNMALVNAIIAKSGKEVSEKSDALKDVIADMRDAEGEEYDRLAEQKKLLRDTPDNARKVPTIVGDNPFRLAVEHIIANIIMEQGAEDPAVILAREEAKKAAKKAQSKARRQEKRKNEKKAESAKA